MTKTRIEISTKPRKKGAQVIVKAGRSEFPKYAGTLSFDEQADAEAFLGLMERATYSLAEVHVDR